MCRKRPFTTHADRLRPRLIRRTAPSRWTCSATRCRSLASTPATSTTTSRPAYATTARDSLSLRDVEELLSERGLEADHTTIWRWVQRYGPELAVGGSNAGSAPAGVGFRPVIRCRGGAVTVAVVAAAGCGDGSTSAGVYASRNIQGGRDGVEASAARLIDVDKGG